MSRSRAKSSLLGIALATASLVVAATPPAVFGQTASAARVTCTGPSAGVVAGFKIDGRLLCAPGGEDWYRGSADCQGVLKSPPFYPGDSCGNTVPERVPSF